MKFVRESIKIKMSWLRVAMGLCPRFVKQILLIMKFDEK